MSSADEKRRMMDREMATVLANHATILSNQDYITTQLHHHHDCLEHLKQEIKLNREVIDDVRNLLSAFKVVVSAAKYATVFTAAFAGMWHAFKAIFSWWKS